MDTADAVIHLAAVTWAGDDGAGCGRLMAVNVSGTETLARACAAANCPLLFPSTTSVYALGDGAAEKGRSPDEIPAQNPYMVSKRLAEEIVLELGANAGLRFTICRLGTIYGVSPGMRFQTAVSKFVWQACAGQPLTVWRTAFDQVRPYLDVEDAVRAFEFLLENRHFDNEIYDLATENVSIRRILGIIGQHIPDTEISATDSPWMNRFSYAADCARSAHWASPSKAASNTAFALRFNSYGRSIADEWGRGGCWPCQRPQSSAEAGNQGSPASRPT